MSSISNPSLLSRSSRAFIFTALSSCQRESKKITSQRPPPRRTPTSTTRSTPWRSSRRHSPRKTPSKNTIWCVEDSNFFERFYGGNKVRNLEVCSNQIDWSYARFSKLCLTSGPPRLIQELSELAISTFKHIGRIRSARFIGIDLANFYLLLGQVRMGGVYCAHVYE